MRIRHIFLLALPLFLLIGCATPAVTAAKKYFAALEQRDFEAAKKYITDGSHEALSWAELDEDQHTYQVIRGEEVSETEYTVYYTVDDDPAEKTVKVINVDGIWLVDLSTEDK